jgi:anti-anti-sigma factor
MEKNYTVTSDIIDDIPVLIIEGDLTSDAKNDVMSTYKSLKEKHSPNNLIINFEKINYINSAGMAIIINIIQDLGEANGKVKFVGLSAHIKNIMDIVGIFDFVEIFNSTREAISEIKGK